MAKRVFLGYPIYAVILVVFIVLYIIATPGISPIVKFAQWISSHTEGFAAPVETPKCPYGYKFFNDERGDSFCCNGSINPYSHICSTSTPDGICAFRPNTADPRNPKRVLTLCSALISKSGQTNNDSFCPGRFPNYADLGKCCLTPTDLDGYNCQAEDNKDTDRYCIVKGTPKSGEQLCSNLRMYEQSTCPTGLQKINYMLGDREIAKYGNSARYTNVPVCFGMDNSCIPDVAIKELQKNGIFKDKSDLNSWKYSCSGYEKVNVRNDMTGTMNNNYP